MIEQTASICSSKHSQRASNYVCVFIFCLSMILFFGLVSSDDAADLGKITERNARRIDQLLNYGEWVMIMVAIVCILILIDYLCRFWKWANGKRSGKEPGSKRLRKIQAIFESSIESQFQTKLAPALMKSIEEHFQKKLAPALITSIEDQFRLKMAPALIKTIKDQFRMKSLSDN